MNVDVENISSKNKKWIPIYKVIDNSNFFNKKNISNKIFRAM